jgi:hypothetical protein
MYDIPAMSQNGQLLPFTGDQRTAGYTLKTVIQIQIMIIDLRP